MKEKNNPIRLKVGDGINFVIVIALFAVAHSLSSVFDFSFVIYRQVSEYKTLLLAIYGRKRPTLHLT